MHSGAQTHTPVVVARAGQRAPVGAAGDHMHSSCESSTAECKARGGCGLECTHSLRCLAHTSTGGLSEWLPRVGFSTGDAQP